MEMTCICCPLGCTLTVEKQEENIVVSGNGCLLGKKYATNEMTAPVRMLTSSVEVRGGDIARLSVKTEREIPKEKIMECMEEIRRVTVCAPVEIGSVVLENCAGTGVRVIATKRVESK